MLSASSGVLDLERYPEKPDLSNGVACHDESDAPQAVDHGRSPVGQPFPHKAAELHVTGEAEYTGVWLPREITLKDELRLNSIWQDMYGQTTFATRECPETCSTLRWY